MEIIHWVKSSWRFENDDDLGPKYQTRKNTSWSLSAQGRKCGVLPLKMMSRVAMPLTARRSRVSVTRAAVGWRIPWSGQLLRRWSRSCTGFMNIGQLSSTRTLLFLIDLWMFYPEQWEKEKEGWVGGRKHRESVLENRKEKDVLNTELLYWKRPSAGFKYACTQ